MTNSESGADSGTAVEMEPEPQLSDGKPRRVENDCPPGPDRRYLLEPRPGYSCENLGANLLGGGICVTDSEPDAGVLPWVAVMEPLCANVAPQGPFGCHANLPAQYEQRVADQFDRVAWDEFGEAKRKVEVVIVDSIADAAKECTGETPHHGCAVEMAVRAGAGLGFGVTDPRLTVRHYQALGMQGNGDESGSVEDLHLALKKATDAHEGSTTKWILPLALGWIAGPKDPSTKLIHDQLLEAEAVGAIIFSAAGNSKEPNCGADPGPDPSSAAGLVYPAALAAGETAQDPPLLTPVGAVDLDGQMLPTTRPGGVVPLVGPGNVLWSVSEGMCEYWSGSSMPTAYIAGIAALTLAHAGPALTTCDLLPALYQGAEGELADVPLKVCGQEYERTRPVSARATLNALGSVPAAITAAAVQLSNDPRVDYILGVAKGSPRVLKALCGDDNYWGPDRSELELHGLECPPKPDPTAVPEVEPEPEDKACATCAGVWPEGSAVMQVILMPGLSSLPKGFVGGENDEGADGSGSFGTAWLVLEVLGPNGKLYVSEKPVIQSYHGIVYMNPKNTLDQRLVAEVSIPPGVTDPRQLRLWIRYDRLGTAIHWESLGRPIMHPTGLTADDFANGTCESPVVPMHECLANIMAGGCDREPGIRHDHVLKPF